MGHFSTLSHISAHRSLSSRRIPRGTLIQKLTANARFICSIALIALFCLPCLGQTDGSSQVIAQMYYSDLIETLNVPIYGHFQDESGQEYVLILAPAWQLEKNLYAYQVLDEVKTLVEDEWYLLAEMRKASLRQKADLIVKVLMDDGKRLLVRATLSQAEKLASLGFEIAWLKEKPLVLRRPERLLFERKVDIIPEVQSLIDQVEQSALYDDVGLLSGESPATIGGEAYTIATRHTSSGEPIEKATQYVYERMEALGLAVSYHNWSNRGLSGRNVIGSMTGSGRPDEIVLVTAHLDDMPSGIPAPGADDNASGSTGVLVAADILSSHEFERTLRFVFFTGEEQGLLGSEAYANAVYSAGENIVAVYNMDMIGWDQIGDPIVRVHTRLPSNPGYPGDLAIAQLFTEVVTNYGLSTSLSPIVDSDGVWASDHASFWGVGYPGILAIEDDVNDFNAYYHTQNDKLDVFNMPYFTAFVKASVGTVAHLGLLEPEPEQGSSYLLWTR